MSVRDNLQKRPAVAAVAAVLVIAFSLAVIRKHASNHQDLSTAGKAFYSDDDGKTWFLDDVAKGSPFDHGGKQAYRALVCRCAGGAPFVAYLAKYSDKQKAADAADLAHAPPGTPSRLLGMPMQDLKKPGGSMWKKNSTPTQSGYPNVACPSGGGNASPVSPADPNSGATK